MLITKPKYPRLSDDELLDNYKVSGDQSLLTELFLRYINLISGVCLKYLKENEAAKDAVFTIYEELIYKTKIYEISNFKSWLFSVTKNHCISELKKINLILFRSKKTRRITGLIIPGWIPFLKRNKFLINWKTAWNLYLKNKTSSLNFFIYKKGVTKRLRPLPAWIGTKSGAWYKTVKETLKCVWKQHEQRIFT